MLKNCFTWELKTLYSREAFSTEYNIFKVISKESTGSERLSGRRHLKAASPCFAPACAEGVGHVLNEEKICDISQFFQGKHLDVLKLIFWLAGSDWVKRVVEPRLSSFTCGTTLCCELFKNKFPSAAFLLSSLKANTGRRSKRRKSPPTHLKISCSSWTNGLWVKFYIFSFISHLSFSSCLDACSHFN